ncbi:MAG: hypothetical protein KY393_00790 [Actinobacteria bacterium]|nr:hypothetical protein [Actinomycetota bacterium]
MKIHVIVLFVGLTLSACGGSSDGSAAMEELKSQVGSIREAAASGDYESALHRLNTMRSEALDMSRQNEISDREFRRILAAALEVEAKLPLMPSPPEDDPSDSNPEESETDPQRQGEDATSSERASRSGGESIDTPDGASGRDGAPGEPGEDGADGVDGVAGFTG